MEIREGREILKMTVKSILPPPPPLEISWFMDFHFMFLKKKNLELLVYYVHNFNKPKLFDDASTKVSAYLA